MKSRRCSNDSNAFFGALLGIALAVSSLSCGSSDKPAISASFSTGTDGGAPPQTQPQPCAPGQVCPPPQQTQQPPQMCPPGQQCNAVDPNQLAALLAAGTALLGQLGGDPVDVGIKTAATRYAPGMSPDGQVAKGNLAEGGHVGFMFTMDPSKCYTIIGFGAGVQDLDITLLAPPLYSLSAGQDGMAGPTAVIGSTPRPMCPIVPLAIPYKIDIFAKKGGGPVGAQVYSKPR